MLAAVLVQAPVAVAQAQKRRHDPGRVMALLVEKFPKFVTWPGPQAPSEDVAWRLCVVGTDHAVEHLLALDGRPAPRGTTIEVHELDPDALAGSSTCHAVWVGSSAVEHLPEVLDATRGHPTLVVGERAEIPENGGHLNFFVLEGAKIRFRLNVCNAERRGITIDSNMIQMAHEQVPCSRRAEDGE